MTAQELIAKVLELENCTKMLKQNRLRRMGRFAPSLARICLKLIEQRDDLHLGLGKHPRFFCIEEMNAELDRIAKGEE